MMQGLGCGWRCQLGVLMPLCMLPPRGSKSPSHALDRQRHMPPSCPRAPWTTASPFRLVDSRQRYTVQLARPASLLYSRHLVHHTQLVTRSSHKHRRSKRDGHRDMALMRKKMSKWVCPAQAFAMWLRPCCTVVSHGKPLVVPHPCNQLEAQCCQRSLEGAANVLC